ncbi:hypothetical protein [Saccharibacter floricola]|uniref:DUF4231 domain-containing protein n=1 Tax=Saccharibacter floricola DSM 15669 TaxID=1123227 RepID=A0ABQ0NZF1_9PROT|nr:hypothetical protein [Saccharibacter floricola]GBQ07316.1 hypothetical protein AA15669_1331 [Saccharibacter floricola DSM 15669]
MTDKQDNDFLLWVSEQQRQMAETIAKEQMGVYERIRSRLAMFLPVLTTTTLAATGGAMAGKFYSPACAILAAGYSITSLCCWRGLYTNYALQSTLISPDYIREIANYVTKFPNPQAETNVLIASYIDNKVVENGKAIWSDRRWLQRVFWGTLLTPALSFIGGLMWLGWRKLC